MNKLVKQFQKAFAMMERKREIGWDKIYIGVDIHETVVKPTWTANIDKEFYEYAKETLQLMSNDKEICLILWSCSRPELNKQYSEFFQENGITFDYINENPEVTSTVYADFDTKLYFNVGLDDKFGFDVDEDWEAIYIFLNTRFMQRELEIERNRQN